MARLASLGLRVTALLALPLAYRALAQSPPPAPAVAPAPTPSAVASPAPAAAAPIEAVPDSARLAPAAAAYRNPLYRNVETAAKLVDRGVLEDLKIRLPLVIAVRLDETGKVITADAVQPPLKALTVPIPALVPKWRFTPAKKGTQPVATWATYGIDLDIELVKGVFSQFDIKPVEREDPLPVVMQEPVGDVWLSRYPSTIEPAEAGTVSIEDVDLLPTPQKASWSHDAARVKTRVRALVEVDAQGKAKRVVPIGGENEPLAVVWVRKSAARWRFTAAQAGGAPAASWLALDATLEFTLDSAKEKGKRSIKKNVRGTPAA
ncbi:MAG TPA: hypothetical protein VGR00_08000 [Thermoanaerobaculia bacterium]|jgi:hypothetical protein|nr:hypothetical protein [Thermoanaerobaculia bacterium]